MKKRGVGMGCMWYGVGNTGLPNPAAAFVEVHSDGSVTVLTGAADIGQGSDTVMCQIVAEALGVHYEDVSVLSADSGVTPESGASSASRQTYISGNACLNAANMAKETIVKVAAELLGTTASNVELRDRRAFDKNDTDNHISYSKVLMTMKQKGIIAVGSGSFNPDTTGLNPENLEGSPYGTYAFATQIVEVEVDTETGEVDVLKIIAAHDVGTAINKQNVEGQIEGGALMGVGYALLEEIELDNGKIKNPNFTSYLINTAMDTPKIYPIIVEEHSETGPFGAKGVGEPTLIPTAPAILSAIDDAIGIRFNEVPVTPEKIIKSLKNGGK